MNDKQRKQIIVKEHREELIERVCNDIEQNLNNYTIFVMQCVRHCVSEWDSDELENWVAPR